MVKNIPHGFSDLLYLVQLNDMHVIYANNNFLHAVGKPLEEITAKGELLFDQIIFPLDLTKVKKNMHCFLLPGKAVKELLFRIIGAEGNPHWIKTRTAVYKQDDQGLPLQIIVFGQEITDGSGGKQSNRKLLQERKETNASEVRELTAAIIKTYQEERKRLAKNLQNGLGNLLYGAHISLSILELDQSGGASGNQLKQKLYTQELLQMAIRECKQLSDELMPPLLEHFGLNKALKNLGQQFSQLLKVNFTFSGLQQGLSEYTEITIFRLFQDLITDLARQPETSWAEMHLNTWGKTVTLTVRDNGNWFSKLDGSMSVSLKSIENKVNLLKGKFTITTKEGQGNLIRIHMPYLPD